MKWETHARQRRVRNRTPDVAMPAPACPSIRTETPQHTIFTLTCIVINERSATQSGNGVPYSEQHKERVGENINGLIDAFWLRMLTSFGI
jgi:hypothetical protein